MFRAKIFLCLFFTSAFMLDSFAQLDIPEDNQLYRVKTWRKIDLREKQNKGFFAFGHEITKYLVDGMISGEVTLYQNFDNGKFENQVDDINSAFAKKDAPDIGVYAPDITYNAAEIVSYNGAFYSAINDGTFGVPPTDSFYWSPIAEEETKGEQWTPTEMGELILIEDVIFDKVRSRLYYDIEAIQIMIPGDVTSQLMGSTSSSSAPTSPGGLQPVSMGVPIPIGFVDYDEVEEFFRGNEDAKWVNRYNPKEWKNFADAFLLRLFYGPIIQYENPDGLPIEVLFRDHDEAVEEMQRYEMYLMEKEHNLWEY